MTKRAFYIFDAVIPEDASGKPVTEKKINAKKGLQLPWKDDPEDAWCLTLFIATKGVYGSANIDED